MTATPDQHGRLGTRCPIFENAFVSLHVLYKAPPPSPPQTTQVPVSDCLDCLNSWIVKFAPSTVRHPMTDRTHDAHTHAGITVM